ncbi:MAG: hypothetical protein M1837_003250 [Sclerophora amabilis]|nr:MAG: hypothetical protein M1837_003250 [Sclerophora amabilis]
MGVMWGAILLRYSRRNRLLRKLLVALLVFVLVDFVSFAGVSIDRGAPELSEDDYPSSPIKTVYIASTHWNSEKVLRRWNKAVVDLVRKLGTDNVYVSVYESGSWDNSKQLLRLLDRTLDQLGVNRTITLDETTHVDEIERPPGDDAGWIDTARGKRELRRVPYLSRLRNKALEPLEQLTAAGKTFDRIIFLNDVVFSTADVMALLHTRDGSYAAACSLDYSKPPHFYDTFALRDSNGNAAFSEVYPYFSSRASRKALAYRAPVPVESCWNGIAVFDPQPFVSGTAPLRFRGIPDSLAKYHLEGSECCLIHADNPLTSSRGVWVNPNVRVGYSPDAYDAVRAWPSTTEVITGWWKASGASLLGLPWRQKQISERVRAWERENPGQSEPGLHCLIDEMQVLVHNGWAHV